MSLPMQPDSPIVQPPTPKKRRTLFIILGIVLVLCVACLGFGAWYSATPTYKAGATATALDKLSQVVTAAPTNTRQSTDLPKPTNTPNPSNTPQPTKTVAPTATPIPGASRDNPIKFGQPALAEDGFEITVLGVVRGQTAWTKIYGYNMFNAKPDEGMEYALVTVGMKYPGDPSKTKRVEDSYFRLVGSTGAIKEQPLMMVVKKKLADELFGGGTTEGEIAFQVGKDEKSLVLIYAGGGQKARFLSLEK